MLGKIRQLYIGTDVLYDNAKINLYCFIIKKKKLNFLKNPYLNNCVVFGLHNYKYGAIVHCCPM